MKKFNKFAEDIDKVAALRARQKATVDRFKSTSEPAPAKKSERKVHSGDIETKNLIDKKRSESNAKAKAASRTAEIRSEIQRQKDDK